MGVARWGTMVRRMPWQLATSLALAALTVATLGLAPAAIPALYLAAVTPELARIDLREHRLPNRLTVTGVPIGLVGAALSWLATGTLPLVPLVASAAFALFLFLLGIAGGMGMGDVKLAALVGLASPTLAIAMLAPLTAFLAAGVVATVVLIRRGRGARIAFGPYLLLGYFAALVLVVGSSIAAGAP